MATPWTAWTRRSDRSIRPPDAPVASKWCQKAPGGDPGAFGFPAFCGVFRRVTDGARTRDLRDHNPMLCQLSYDHQAVTSATTGFYQQAPCPTKKPAGPRTCSVPPTQDGLTFR